MLRKDFVDKSEMKVYRQLAKDFLNMTEKEIQKMIENGKLYEVKSHEEDIT